MSQVIRIFGGPWIRASRSVPVAHDRICHAYLYAVTTTAYRYAWQSNAEARRPCHRERGWDHGVHVTDASPHLDEPMDSVPGRSPRRPLAVTVALVLFVVGWLEAVVYAAVLGAVDLSTARDLVLVLLWSAVAASWTHRVWQGGPMAWHAMTRICLVIGAVGVAWLLLANLYLDGLFDEVAELSDRDEPHWAAVNGPGIAYTLTALGVGLLLRRRDVRRWVHARSAEQRADR